MMRVAHDVPALARVAVLRLACVALLAAALCSCDLAPTYTRPSMILPDDYQGSGPFVRAQPSDDVHRGPWWTMFGDPQLDRLETQLDAANPDLQAAEEAYTQARDIVGEARSGLFPQLGSQAFATENKESSHTLFHTGTGPTQQPSTGYGIAASWEPDFWDQIRNETQAAQQSAQASAAHVAAARLVLELDLATDYLGLREDDDQHAVYTRAIESYTLAVKITQMRLDGKISSGLDVARAQNQLASARASDTEVLAQRAVLQHAIAVLTGASPSTFKLASATGAPFARPDVPVEFPSALLQRRPDIAEAERNMAAANTLIGVARAAFYPNIRISANAGFEDTGLALASLPNSLWAVGASAVLPLFEGGLRRAELQRSWSQLAQSSDQYRSTVLAAFREVEDQLALAHELAIETDQQAEAVSAAKKAEGLAELLYRDGLDNYLNVTVAQVALLSAQIAQTQAATRQLQASVALVAALGGDWDAGRLPKPDQTLPNLSANEPPGAQQAEYAH